MTPKEDVETFCPESRQAWCAWLEINHDKKQSIWLIYKKKNANKPTVLYSEAVDEALCFGYYSLNVKKHARKKSTKSWI